MFSEQKHTGAMCACVGCPSDSTAGGPESSQCVESFQKQFLEQFFSHSSFKRQNLRLGDLGAELKNSKKIMIKK